MLLDDFCWDLYFTKVQQTHRQVHKHSLLLRVFALLDHRIVQAVEAQACETIGDRHERISKGMFAPIEPGFGDSMNFKGAALIRDNGSAGIMAITFKAENNHKATIAFLSPNSRLLA